MRSRSRMSSRDNKRQREIGFEAGAANWDLRVLVLPREQPQEQPQEQPRGDGARIEQGQPSHLQDDRGVAVDHDRPPAVRPHVAAQHVAQHPAAAELPRPPLHRRGPGGKRPDQLPHLLLVPCAGWIGVLLLERTTPPESRTAQ